MNGDLIINSKKEKKTGKKNVRGYGLVIRP